MLSPSLQLCYDVIAPKWKSGIIYLFIYLFIYIFIYLFIYLFSYIYFVNSTSLVWWYSIQTNSTFSLIVMESHQFQNKVILTDLSAKLRLLKEIFIGDSFGCISAVFFVGVSSAKWIVKALIPAAMLIRLFLFPKYNVQ